MSATARLRLRPVEAPRRALRAPAKVAAAPAMPVASPIIKWVGGKTKLLPELLKRRPEKFRRYFEPFVGGGALFYRLAPGAAVLGDRNADLIATYRAVAAGVDEIIDALTEHRARHGEAYYYEMRARWNDATVRWTTTARAAAFIYLNKTCYNGLWRVNRGGGFNVPMGRYASPQIFDGDELRAASALLRRATFRVGGYDATVADAADGDFAYFDPPYHPVSATANFTSYTADAFGEAEQARLADTARALAARGCAVMLSNSDTPFIRSLYTGFQVDRVQCPRAINSDPAARGNVDELIISSGF
jgi:DNA adenine methylase